MTMTAILFAGDDEDVVESSVRHNLHHVDAVFVVGIDSRDRTGEIVGKIAAEGLPVAWTAAPGESTRRSFAAAALRHLAGQEAVRHIVILGADTFIEGPPTALRDAVLCAPDAVHLLPRRLRVPTEGDDWSEADPYLRLTHTRMMEFDQRFVAVIPRVRFAEAPIHPGGLFGEADLPDAAVVEDLEALQLPIRNACQLPGIVAARVRELALDSAAGLPDRRERVRFWMRMGEIVRDRPLLAPERLREAAASYEAQDPVPLAEDRPHPFTGHAIRYPADSAIGLDRANAMIEDIHRTSATRIREALRV